MALAKFIYDKPENCPDILYATDFAAPDAFIFFETRGKKYMVMSDLEFNRATKTAKVDRVLSLSKYAAKTAKKLGVKPPNSIQILQTIFKEYKITQLEVPPLMSCALVDALRDVKLKVKAGQSPFYPQRLIKNAGERKKIEAAQKIVFKAMGKAEETLRASKVKGGVLHFDGKVLTSEKLREIINIELLRNNFIVPEGTIVACGRDAMDPHNAGKGPIRPHESIVIDIFPKSMDTFFWGDATRTFCVGKAPEKLVKLYDTVKRGQEFAIKTASDGVLCRTIHDGIIKIFEEAGFKTGEINGSMQGFIHSTGHGIGLEIHEAPRIASNEQVLKAGMITSIEPGLYYKGLGGVRIEDLIHVTKNGCEIIAGYHKRLEII